MPAKKRVLYFIGQVVEVAQGRGKKCVTAEIKNYKRRMVGTHGYYRSGTGIHEVSYQITYDSDPTKIVWVDQSRIKRVVPPPTQEELEARARKLFGEDYL